MLILINNLFNLKALKKLNPYKRKRVVEAYLRAVDSGTLITSLPLLREDPAALPETPRVIERCRLTRADKLLYIKNARPIKSGTWMIRPIGHTEQINPEHRVAVVDTTLELDTVLIVVATTALLLPAVDEYVDILYDAVKKKRGRVAGTIDIDAECRIDALEKVLAGAPIELVWFPTMPKELLWKEGDSDTDSDIDPITHLLAEIDIEQCTLCSAPHTDSGAKLLRCGHCRIARYCCQDHQKIDWPNHRKLCKIVKQKSP